MKIEIGNGSAIEAVPKGDGSFVFTPMRGERVTTIVIPGDDPHVGDAVSTVIKTVQSHMTETPIWVECDHPGVLAMLEAMWKLDPKKNKRPARWGDGSTMAKLKKTQTQEGDD